MYGGLRWPAVQALSLSRPVTSCCLLAESSLQALKEIWLEYYVSRSLYYGKAYCKKKKRLVRNNETPIMIGQLNPHNKPLTQLLSFRCGWMLFTKRLKRAHKRFPLPVVCMVVLIKNVNVDANADCCEKVVFAFRNMSPGNRTFLLRSRAVGCSVPLQL